MIQEMKKAQELEVEQRLLQSFHRLGGAVADQLLTVQCEGRIGLLIGVII
jgi:hypothetical protein